MSRAFQSRRIEIDKAVSEHGLVVAGAGVFGGSSLWMRTADHSDAAPLVEELRHKGVLIEPGAPFFGHTGASPYFRLAYSSIPVERIAKGIEIIADTMAPSQKLDIN